MYLSILHICVIVLFFFAVFVIQVVSALEHTAHLLQPEHTARLLPVGLEMLQQVGSVLLPPLVADCGGGVQQLNRWQEGLVTLSRLSVLAALVLVLQVDLVLHLHPAASVQQQEGLAPAREGLVVHRRAHTSTHQQQIRYKMA